MKQHSLAFHCRLVLDHKQFHLRGGKVQKCSATLSCFEEHIMMKVNGGYHYVQLEDIIQI